MPTVNDLPTRNELISRPVTLEGVRPVVRDYVDGVLMTREEFIASLEAAPLFVYPDSNGGYTITVVEDDSLVAVAQSMADKNNWSDGERDNLYEAMCDFLAVLGEDTE